MTKHESVRAGRLLDAELHLLDRQVLDRDDVPITAVDDLELEDVPVGEDLDGVEAPLVTNLLSGSVLRTRLFGGHPPSRRRQRIPWAAVRELGTAIRVDFAADELEPGWPERWVREQIIERIPGGRHDPE